AVPPPPLRLRRVIQPWKSCASDTLAASSAATTSRSGCATWGARISDRRTRSRAATTRRPPPAIRPGTDEVRTMTERTSGGPAEPAADAVRVLVVDDEPAIADLVGT